MRATPSLWLHFYYFLVHQLKHQGLTYLQALESTITHFRMKQ